MQTPVRSVARRYACYGVLALLGSGGAPGAGILCAAEPPPAGEAAPGPEVKGVLPVEQDPAPPQLPPDSAIERPESAPPVEPEYWGNVDRPIQHDPAEADDPDFAWRKTWRESPQWGGRMGYVDQNGNLRVTLRYDPSTPWVIVAKGVKDFQLLDWRLTVLKEDGRLLFSEGELNSPFREIDKDVTAFQMTLTRVGSLHADGTLVVKEEGFQARTVAKGVQSFQITFDGHFGVLGFDGSLYLQHGTTVTPESASLLAKDVTAFQIEREWVSYVQRAGSGNRLLVGKEQSDDPFHKVGPFEEVATNVDDFEAQVEVAFAGPEMRNSRLHVAALNNGQLKLYDGTKPALTEKAAPNPGHALAKVSWSGAQLACLGTKGELSVSSIDEDGPREFQQLGKVADYRISGQGAALVALDGGSLKLIEIAAVPAPVVRDDASMEEKAAAIAKQVKAARTAIFDLQGQRDLVTRPELARKGGAIGLSSMRPEYTRRPVGIVPGAASVDAAAPATISFVPAETASEAAAMGQTFDSSAPPRGGQ